MSAWCFADTKGDGLCAGQCSIERRQETQSVVPLDAAAWPAPESHAGAGTKSVPLRKAHVAHKWGQKGLDRAIQGHPEYTMAYRCCAANIQVLCSTHHHCRDKCGRDKCDRHWEAQKQQGAPGEMTEERGHTQSREGCFPLHQALREATKPHSNLSCCKGLWDHPNNLSRGLDA